LSPTQIKATVSVPSQANIGDYTVNVTNGGSTLYLPNGFRVNELSQPQIQSVTPDSAYIGQKLDVTITGLNTNFTKYTQGSGTTEPIISFYNYQQGSGTTLNVSNVKVLSPTQIQATVSVPLDASLGYYDLICNTFESSLKLKNGFKIYTKNLGFENKSYVNNIKCYPNPVKEFLKVDIPNNEFSNCNNYQIINFNGQIISNNLINSKSFEVRFDEFITKGNYILLIFDKQGNIITTNKFIIN
jgi:uncharacterized membrane protein